MVYTSSILTDWNIPHVPDVSFKLNRLGYMGHIVLTSAGQNNSNGDKLYSVDKCRVGVLDLNVLYTSEEALEKYGYDPITEKIVYNGDKLLVVKTEYFEKHFRKQNINRVRDINNLMVEIK